MEIVPTFEMLIENEMTDGVFGMSLVDEPAILVDYVLLSKNDKIQIELKLEKLADKKRHIVSGAALVPDMIIPRNGYNITFSSDTIRKISENFIINGNKDNVSLQHQVPVNGINLVESWIVEDPEKDKSSTLGLKVPKGTWCISMKIKDDNLWKEYIESGILKGFSLEGQFTQKEIEVKLVKQDDELEKDLFDIALAITYSKRDLDKQFVWRTNNKENKCPSCSELDGKVHTLREWIKLAIPGVPENTELAGETTSYPHSPYSTFCADACKCKLVKI